MADRKVSLAEPLLFGKQTSYGGAGAEATPLGRISISRAASFAAGAEEDGVALLEWAGLSIRASRRAHDLRRRTLT